MAAGVRRIVGGAVEIDGEHVAAHSAAEQLERAHDHGIVLGGVVHRQRASARFAAAIISSHSATVGAIGFSTKTSQPISSASTASLACDAGGVGTWTTSGRAAHLRTGKHAGIPKRWPSPRPVDGRVGDPDDADVGKRLQGADVVALTYPAPTSATSFCAMCSSRDVFFLPNPVLDDLDDLADRASHVMRK